jgi:hypothetical protein
MTSRYTLAYSFRQKTNDRYYWMFINAFMLLHEQWFTFSATLGRCKFKTFNVPEILFILKYWNRQTATCVNLISECIVPKAETVTK